MKHKWSQEDHNNVARLRESGLTLHQISTELDLPISSIQHSLRKSQQSTPEGSNSLQLRVEELENTLNSMQEVILFMGNKMRSELEAAPKKISGTKSFMSAKI